MRIEPIPSSLVKEFWDILWSIITKPVEKLGGLGYFVVVLIAITILLLVYRFPVLRRFVVAFLVSTWIAVAVSIMLIAVGGG
ncbi:MAG: hypothetical protein QW794_08005 [Thermosphaera sp.]